MTIIPRLRASRVFVMSTLECYARKTAAPPGAPELCPGQRSQPWLPTPGTQSWVVVKRREKTSQWAVTASQPELSELQPTQASLRHVRSNRSQLEPLVQLHTTPLPNRPKLAAVALGLFGRSQPPCPASGSPARLTGWLPAPTAVPPAPASPDLWACSPAAFPWPEGATDSRLRPASPPSSHPSL